MVGLEDEAKVSRQSSIHSGLTIAAATSLGVSGESLDQPRAGMSLSLVVANANAKTTTPRATFQARLVGTTGVGGRTAAHAVPSQ